MPKIPGGLLGKLKSNLPVKRGKSPLWLGPESDQPLGGITFSSLCKFLNDRERFRIEMIDGLKPHDRWNHRIGYGNLWHACEEAHANNESWGTSLTSCAQLMGQQYPEGRADIQRWTNVCAVQFPVYVDFWSKHPDVVKRTPLFQEQVFNVPYHLPSSRTIYLKGKWDSVDDIERLDYVQENKTKSDIDFAQLRRQLTFDLQTMTYVVAYTAEYPDRRFGGVRYNVVRRPLSGGKGSISRHKGTKGTKCPTCKGTGTAVYKRLVDPIRCPKCHGAGRTGGKPDETDDHFYDRLADIIRNASGAEWGVKDNENFFFARWKVRVSSADIQKFKDTCLDPILENLSYWYDEQLGKAAEAVQQFGYPPSHWRHPYGVYNVLDQGGSTDYDHYLETGSTSGLRRITTLFTELQDA